MKVIRFYMERYARKWYNFNPKNPSLQCWLDDTKCLLAAPLTGSTGEQGVIVSATIISLFFFGPPNGAKYGLRKRLRGR